MIKIELDQKAMSKTRKFIYFVRQGTTDINSTRYTVAQAQTIVCCFNEQGIDFVNNTGLIL